jgi:predicted ATPase/DNA-binding CsgD family transcriptional regulator
MAASAVSHDPQTDLPRPPTRLVGREREVAALSALLADEGERLLSLTGPGGVGKTRLAVAVASAAAERFPDGARFVGLAAVSDTALVAPTVAQALGVREAGEAPLADRLAVFLRDKRLLLILDNFEQVVEAAPLVADLLAACPGLAVLATSRVRLRLSGEREVAVAPLALPTNEGRAARDDAAAADAVRLFVERARAVRADFALTEANAGAVADICRRLDGLPLALELAAARVKVLPAAALLAKLERRLPLLTGGGRDLPARQRTMRDAVAWSHDLLTDDERVLFRRLAVCVGGFDLEAAEAVAGDAGIGVLEGVAALADASLLREEEDPDGEPRYLLLETVREFGLERLAASGEENEVRDRHAAFFLDLAERAPPAWADWGPAMFDRVERELGNLRAALGRFLARGDAAAALRLAEAPRAFWWTGRHLGEGRTWLERSLALGGEAPDGVRAWALVTLGRCALLQGDTAAAEAAGREGLAIFRARGDAYGTVFALNTLGLVALERGEHDRATGLIEEARAAARAGGAPHWDARLLTNLGIIAAAQGDLERAAALYDEGLQFARRAGSRWPEALLLGNLAWVAIARGDLRRGARLAQEGLALVQELRYPLYLADVVGIAAILAGRLGNHERAARLLGAAEAQRERLGTPVNSFQRSDYERCVARARAGLGEDAFAAAWAAGRALSLADAVAEAAAVFAGAAGGPVPQPPLPDPAARFGLTRCEQQVLRLLAKGLSNPEIADALIVSPRTAQTHVSNILGKLGVHGRAEAVAIAVRHGIA